MRITSKGQVTIPRPLREKYGLTPDAEVEFVDTGEGVALRRAKKDNSDFREWLESVRGITRGKMTTDEIMHMTRGEED